MFRSAKRKAYKRNVRLTKDDPESDDDKDQTVVLANHLTGKKNKRKQTVSVEKKEVKERKVAVRSFEIEEEGALEVGKKKSKRKKKGMGYGGSTTPSSLLGTGNDETETENGEKETLKEPGHGYSQSAINKLKVQQRNSRPSVKPATTSGPFIISVADTPVDGTNIPSQAKDVLRDASSKDNAGVRMGGVLEKGVSKSDSQTEQWPSTDGLQDMKVDESTEWESNVTARAGIAPAGRTPQHNIDPPSLPTLSALRQQLQSTIESLDDKNQDSSSSLLRREAELEQAKRDLEGHRQTQRQCNNEQKFYQNLREDVILCVGALREIHERLGPIESSCLELCTSDQTKRKTYEEWQDDVAAALTETGELNTVLGRKATTLSNTSTEKTIDEFGRDVKSQFAIQQEQRHQSRMQLLRTIAIDQQHLILSLLCKEENSDDVALRYNALQEALDLTLNEVDEGIASFQNIIHIFKRWFDMARDEYNQSYAYMSLADLMSVQVRVQFMKSSWLAHVIKLDSNAAATVAVAAGTLKATPNLSDVFSFLDLLGASSLNEATGSTTPNHRILEKSMMPFLVKLMTIPAERFLLSKELSGQLTSITKRIMDLTAKRDDENDNRDGAKALLRAAKSSIEAFVSSSSILIVKPSPNLRESSEIDEHSPQGHARWYATKYQLKFFQEILHNLFLFWLPLFTADGQEPDDGIAFAKSILDLAGNYLHLLSTFEREVARPHFASIYNALMTKNRDIVASPKLMLHAAPLRAGAVAYGMDI